MRHVIPWLATLCLACASSPDGLLPSDCTADETYTTQCGDCGPTDACLDPYPVCAPSCEGEFTPCDDEGGVCLDGVCLQNLCG